MTDVNIRLGKHVCLDVSLACYRIMYFTEVYKTFSNEYLVRRKVRSSVDDDVSLFSKVTAGQSFFFLLLLLWQHSQKQIRRDEK